jgi:hypothetical protein
MEDPAHRRMQGPGPRATSGIVFETLRLYLSQIVPVTAIASIVAIPLVAAGRVAFGPEFLQLVARIPLRQTEPMPDSIAVAVTVYALLYLIGLLAISGAIAEVTVRSIVGHELCISRAYVASANRLPYMLGASLAAALIAGLPIGIGALAASSLNYSAAGWLAFALMASLGLHVFVRFAFVVYIALLERSVPTESLARSWTLTAGTWWRTFGLLLLIMLVASAVQTVLDLATGSFPEVGALLSAIVVTPLAAIGNALIYLDLRARKENYTLEQLDKDVRAITDG